MSINSNFPFDITNIEDNEEILPFVQGYSNYVFPGQNIKIIPDTVIPLDKVLDFKEEKVPYLDGNVPSLDGEVQENFTQVPTTEQVQLQVQSQLPTTRQEIGLPKLPLPVKPVEPREKIEPTQKMEAQPNLSILKLVNSFEQKQKELEEKQKELEMKQIEIEKKQKGSDDNYISLVNIQDNTLADTGTVMNPVNILARERSKITTNPFIPNEQKIKEFEVIDKRANEIMQRKYDKNDIYNFSINEINKKISKSTVEFLDDLFIKPENENWIEYLQVILLKNERYVYFGFILIMFVIFMKFIE